MRRNEIFSKNLKKTDVFRVYRQSWLCLLLIRHFWRLSLLSKEEFTWSEADCSCCLVLEMLTGGTWFGYSSSLCAGQVRVRQPDVVLPQVRAFCGKHCRSSLPEQRTARKAIAKIPKTFFIYKYLRCFCFLIYLMYWSYSSGYVLFFAFFIRFGAWRFRIKNQNLLLFALEKFLLRYILL